jgi:predicted peptidase
MNAANSFRCGYYEIDDQVAPCPLFVPLTVDAQSAVPFGLFLHGSGEKGDDGTKPTKVGLGPAILEFPERFNFMVAFPQCPTNRYWTDDNVQKGLLRLVDRISNERDYNGRIFVTGLSEGGSGALHFGVRYPSKVGALLSICPAVESFLQEMPWFARFLGNDKYVARRLVNVPVWLFHGDADPRIPVSASRNLAKVINANDGLHHYTEYAGLNHHECWERAYSDPQLPQWISSQFK